MTLKDLLEDEREEGRAEGFEKGCSQGSLTKAREMAKALCNYGVDISVIASASGLSEAEIKSFSL